LSSYKTVAGISLLTILSKMVGSVESCIPFKNASCAFNCSSFLEAIVLLIIVVFVRPPRVNNDEGWDVRNDDDDDDKEECGILFKVRVDVFKG